MSPVHCLRGLSLTTATFVLDLDHRQMSATDRLRLLVDVGRHFSLPVELFRLRPPPVDRPLLDLSSALAAGPGDLPPRTMPLRPGLLVQWDVGCGNVRAELMPSLELLETSAADGRLSRAIVGRPPVVGWHIVKTSRSRPQTLSRSPKHAPPRYAAPTATPALPVAVIPTAKTDVVTVTVQTPPSTVASTATTTRVVIVPTATITWTMTPERPTGRTEDERLTSLDRDDMETETEQGRTRVKGRQPIGNEGRHHYRHIREKQICVLKW